MSVGPSDSPDRQALVVLLELTQNLVDAHPLEDSLQKVCDAVLQLIPGDHSSVRLLDASQQLLVGARSGSGRELPPMSFKPGEGLIGWVIEHGEGLFVNDAPSDPRFLPDKVMGDRGFIVRSLLAEPLWSGGTVIGCISVSSPIAEKFSPFHHLLIRLLANCSSPPVERARLRRLAMTDDLTLSYNHRYLGPRCQEEIERARRNSATISVLFLDLDHFKKVNDLFGHAAGDRVLRLFADRVRNAVRRIDVLVRRGGEEFVLIMPQTDREQAKLSADRILLAISSTPFDVDGVEIPATVSIGLATWKYEETVESLLQRADIAMYRAKEMGRNRLELANDEESPRPSMAPPKPPAAPE